MTSNCLSSLVNTCTLYIVCLSFCLLTSSILVYLCQGWFDLMHVHSSEQVLNPESSNGDCKWRRLTRLIWVTVKGRNWLLLQKWLLTEVGSWQTIGGNIFAFEGKHSNPKWRNQHHGGNDRLRRRRKISEKWDVNMQLKPCLIPKDFGLPTILHPIRTWSRA